MPNKAPHREKLAAAVSNPKCKSDTPLLEKAQAAYKEWIARLNAISSTGKQKVVDMTRALNEYKDYLEVELIARHGSAFIKRQKGQLKLDNSILEEFLMYLIHPSILHGIPDFEIEVGPQTVFMSLSFRPASLSHLDNKPDVVLKVKDQDFAIGKTIYYKFSPKPWFGKSATTEGDLFLAVLAAECKVNFDKTMFQECAGTASFWRKHLRSSANAAFSKPRITTLAIHQSFTSRDVNPFESKTSRGFYFRLP